MRVVVTLAIVAFVVLEAAAFALVSQAIGILAALALGLASTIAGFVLLRRQGLATMRRIRAEAAAGQLPTAALIEAAVLAAAALLMVLPGFITDATGIILFVPAIRQRLGTELQNRLSARARRAAARPGSVQVINLERTQYASRQGSESPWRGPAG